MALTRPFPKRGTKVRVTHLEKTDPEPFGDVLALVGGIGTIRQGHVTGGLGQDGPIFTVIFPNGSFQFLPTELEVVK